MNSRPKISFPSGYIKPYRLVQPLNTKALNKSWTQDEIQIVLNQVQAKRSPEDISKKLNRPITDIRSKLKAIAAEMYFKDNVPYEQIHSVTGVEKDSLIITSSSSKDTSLDNISDIEDDHVKVDVSIYDFPHEAIETKPDRMVHVDIKDNRDEMIVTVSVESPFCTKSICENISTPIFNTFVSCSRFAKNLSGFSQIQH